MSNPLLTIAKLLPCFVLVLSAVPISFAQTTEFTYQGRLTDGSLPPTASYDFEFRLFTVDTGSAAIGTLQRLGTTVSSGIFTVSLDFGSQFDGTARFLEIAVKPAGSPNPFTTLTPRQPLSSEPYSIRSLNSANALTANNSLQLGGIAAGQFVQTNDARLTDDRVPLPGSANYIQNANIQQAASNFNISGNGTAAGTLSGNVVNAATQFNINGQRMMSSPGPTNTFVGIGAGSVTIANDNSFFGRNAGAANTTGNINSFFGASAGQNNTTGVTNSFFGFGSGFFNTTASGNSFFGFFAGRQNSTGTRNAFFGSQAGDANGIANDNSFFGANSGQVNTGSLNSFFGSQTGLANTNGTNNSIFGANAGDVNTSGSRNSFFGSSAGGANTTGNSNSFYGVLSGGGTTIGTRNSFFGDGSGFRTTTGELNVFAGFNSGETNTTGSNNTFIGFDAGVFNQTGTNNTAIGSNSELNAVNLSHATVIGADAVVSTSNTIMLGRDVDDVVIPGNLQLGSLGAATATALCWNNVTHIISVCSSSLRYKTQVQSFNEGLSVVRRLQPISFRWKDNMKMSDVGFAAESVNSVEPLLTTYNQKGEIEGVKYAQLTTVLVNAVKEQQVQIEEQQRQIRELQEQVRSLTNLSHRRNLKAKITRSR